MDDDNVNFDYQYETDSDVSNDNVTLISKLDLGSPLHLHPNDSSTLSIVSIKLKGTENYKVWSCAMILALESKNKIGFIDGTCRRSNTDEVLGRQWDRCNAVVISWILNSIAEELYLGQIFFGKASLIWKELKEAYDKVDGSVTFNLHHKINSLCQNGMPIADYYHKLNALWKQFDALIQLPRCTCHAAADFSKNNQLLKLMQFLMGLDDIYMHVRSNILTKDPLPDVKTAYSLISREESHRGISSSSMSQKSQNSVFASKFVNKGNTASNLFQRNNKNSVTQSGYRNQSSVVREHFGFNGHTMEKCFKLIGYPSDFGKKKGFQKKVSNNSVATPQSSDGNVQFSDEQLARIVSMIKESTQEKNVVTNMAGHPNGTYAYIQKIGNLKLTKTLTLFDVFAVPEYCVSLLSVHKLAKDSKMSVLFDDYKCYILNQDLSAMKVLGIGNQCDGLYYICDESEGELVHLDVWGPYKVIGRGGFGYFLTIVGDYSRVVWVYLLKSKDEVFANVVVFFNLLKNQFGKTIKTLRSDNGTEFINNSFVQFVETNGIVHRTFVAYSPQQNGIVERKHRHLLNLARSLMFQGGIPLSLWPECILTATYLINRLPSSVLLGKSPYELVFGHVPSLSHLRSFGCLVFAKTLNNFDNFSSRSIKCIMLGYSNRKKAYKLMSLDDRKIFFSRDVKFFEDKFPLKENLNNSTDNTISDNSIDQLSIFEQNEYPNTSYDEVRENAYPSSEGSDPSHSGSVTEDITNEEVVAATHEDNENNSEGDVIAENDNDFVANENAENDNDLIVNDMID
uniref:uncharacterized protein LOC122583139 n=1 Tax=Erigeron canadensis TaxID=72917 RepID=UPI001CB962BA|nr:uncharacterized protein LOC122583139 [Erigeron canadensis]